MAVIGQESRDLAYLESPTPGPGVYDTAQKPPKQSSYAPFMAMESRFASKSDIRGLGPGAYDLRTPIGTPCFTRFENKTNIVIKVNDFGSSAFRSGTERFDGSHVPTPGPGDYTSEADNLAYPAKKPFVTRSCDRPMMNLLRNQNREQRLKRDQQFSNVASAEEINIDGGIGPGSYSLHESAVKKSSQGAVWSLSKVKRFEEKARNYLPQPQLTNDQVRRSREVDNARNPSPFFRSQTVKSYFDQLTYETSSHVKMSIRKQMNYKSSSPAPGSYQVQQTQRQKNPAFQFFGSTEERFKLLGESQVGPGEYFVPSGFGGKQSKQVQDCTRRTDFQRNNWQPGPGAYEYSSAFVVAKPHTNIEQFGSLQPRFKIGQEQPTLDRKSKINLSLDYSRDVPKHKSEHKKRPTVLHKPKPRRLLTQTEGTPFGQYDVQKNDIGRIAQRKKTCRRQLEECFVRGPAFNSGVTRFKAGDGEHLDSTSIPRLFQSQAEEALGSSMFRSQTSREPFSRKDGPGVGLYVVSKPMLKQTFNRKYSGKPCGVRNKYLANNRVGRS